MASAVDKQPAAARLVAVAAAGYFPTATNGCQNSYTTPGETTFDPIGLDEERARFCMENMVRRRRGPLASHRNGSRRRKR